MLKLHTHIYPPDRHNHRCTPCRYCHTPASPLAASIHGPFPRAGDGDGGGGGGVGGRGGGGGMWVVRCVNRL